MIKITDLTYKYKTGDQVLKNINLEINTGEFVCIVGKNGSGKSTLGKLIAGLLKPTKGQILIDEIDISKKENFLQARQTVGIVFQNPENQLIFNNIQDEMKFALNNLEIDNAQEKIDLSLSQVGMQIDNTKDIFELSLGQKQRIAIAEVLSLEPKYIVCDEPTTMLDSKGKEDVYEIIKKLKEQGYTIVYITNYADEMLLADRIIIVDNAEVVKEIKKEDLLDNLECLKQYEIKIPTIVQILAKLREKGIYINLSDLSTEEIIERIIGELR